MRNHGRVSWIWWVVKHMKDPPISAILTNQLRLYYDGGSRGNPGMGGSGWIILERRSSRWIPLKAGWHYHTEPCSNNQAELHALWAGLSEAVKHEKAAQTQITVIGDSQLVQRILLNQYRTKKFQTQTQNVHRLLAQFLQISVVYTKRCWNTMADHLANII
jgi:ribonuclease HI